MIEPTVTAEDLSLYALGLLEGDEQAQVDAMLRKSTAAREELANIRGDLALFAMAAEQHTPPALTRQRLLKQVARERRTVPVELPLQDNGAPSRTQAFTADRSAEHGSQRSVERIALRAADVQEIPARTQPRSADTATEPHAAAGSPKAPQTRTFPSRSQQIRAAAAASTTALPVPRIRQEPQVLQEAVDEEPATTSSPATFAGDPGTFAADRQTFSIDPQVFPREARSLGTSAPAHSVTMFEQHFAADSVDRTREPELPPDPEAYSGRRSRSNADAIGSVQDRFVPSAAAREQSFGFSSYRERVGEETRPGAAVRWMNWAGWAVAAAVAVAAAMALRDDFSQREQVSQQRSSLLGSEASAARAETVLQTLQSPSSQHFLVTRTDAAPAPSGRVAYLPERGTIVFQGSNLETLQPYKTYQLWLIPAGEGRQPIPAGLFKPDGHGYATVVVPQIQKGVIAANFGVTIEDEGGSATPTLPILLVGQQS